MGLILSELKALPLKVVSNCGFNDKLMLIMAGYF